MKGSVLRNSGRRGRPRGWCYTKSWALSLNGGILVEVVVSSLDETLVFHIGRSKHLDKVRHGVLLPVNQVGNVTITAFWKVFADRTGDASLVAHAQQAVIVADWIFTLPAIALILFGGYGMVSYADIDPFGSAWLIWGQVLFLISGCIWLGILVPAQIRQGRAARALQKGEPLPESYWQDGRLWLVWGIAATAPLIAAIYVMIVRV